MRGGFSTFEHHHKQKSLPVQSRKSTSRLCISNSYNPCNHLRHLLAPGQLFVSALQERGNDNARFWYNRVSDFLPSNSWMRIGLRQMSGLLLLVYARNEIQVNLGFLPANSTAHAVQTPCHCMLDLLALSLYSCIIPMFFSKAAAGIQHQCFLRSGIFLKHHKP